LDECILFAHVVGHDDEMLDEMRTTLKVLYVYAHTKHFSFV
jgi:hypothetical protein